MSTNAATVAQPAPAAAFVVTTLLWRTSSAVAHATRVLLSAVAAHVSTVTIPAFRFDSAVLTCAFTSTISTYEFVQTMHADTSAPTQFASVPNSVMLTDHAAPAIFAESSYPSMLANTSTTAIFAVILCPSVFANAATTAIFAHPPFPSMLANTTTPAIFAVILCPSVFANTTTTAIFAHSLESSMFANTTTPAIFAEIPRPAVLANSSAPTGLLFASRALHLRRKARRQRLWM